MLFKVLVRLGVSAAALYFVLRSIDLSAFWQRVQGMNPAWMVLALAAFATTQSVSVWRWNRLLRAQHIEVERRRLTESMWVSMFFNNFLPSNIGGDVVRIADTASAAGSKTLATTVILIDRVIGLAALVIVAASGAFIAQLLGMHIPGARWLWAASAIGAVAAISVITMPQLVGHLLMPLRALNKPWITERTQRLEDAVIRFRNAPSAIIGAFGGALVVQITIVAFYLLTAEGLSVPLPIFLGAVLIPVSLVVQMAPVSINGFGVREAVFAFFFRRFGLPADAAVALSLVSTGMVMGLSLVGGYFFMRRR
ncbi:MAG TPA: lysylphosphatidylglycerol synthase transmembrane domain-containing protein [Vicinamibacterales bacterium]|nr:lysylphosphatidylglycerol synthase transmembrane domain-containing protein [Vicinamibacterales bacterium]